MKKAYMKGIRICLLYFRIFSTVLDRSMINDQMIGKRGCLAAFLLAASPVLDPSPPIFISGPVSCIMHSWPSSRVDHFPFGSLPLILAGVNISAKNSPAPLPSANHTIESPPYSVF